MFRLFQAKPPLSPWEKAWTEDRMSWFTDQLGFNRMVETETLAPDDGRIPSASNYDEAVELLKFLGSWIKLDTSQFRLQVQGEVVPAEQLAAFDGTEKQILHVHENQLRDRDTLVAVLAWQLANEVMTDGTLRDVKLADQGWTTDLLPALWGLGIFAANHILREPQKEANHFAWWGMRQRAYLPGRVFGYAMALQEFVRENDGSRWAGYLRQDPQSALLEGLKYLRKTNDTTFSRESARQPRSRLSIGSLADELRTGSPSRKITAMWELSKRATQADTESAGQIVALLTGSLRDKQAEVRAVAVCTLPLFDLSAHAAQDVADALKDSNNEVRIAAAGALRAFVGVDDETLANDLRDALKDSDRLVVFNAARSLTHYGDAAQPAVKVLLKRLRQALVECRDGDARTILSAIDSIVEDTPRALADFFPESDREFHEFALQMLEQMTQPAT